MKLSLAISLRYLGPGGKPSSRGITILAIAGIAVGVMVLFVTMGVMTGFQVELQSRILAIESHLVVMRYGGSVEHYQRIREIIRGIEGVRSVAPVIYTQAMLRGPAGTSAVVIRAVKAEGLSSAGQGFLAPVEEALAEPAGKQRGQGEIPMAVGKVLAEKLGLTRGTSAVVLIPGSGARSGHLPRMYRCQVGGFFETGMNEYDGAMAYMRLEDIQQMLQMPDSVSALEVRVDDVYRAPQVAGRILELLGYQYWAQDWQQMNRNLFSMLRLQKILMYIIMTLIIFVAAFNISSALVMMVNEKRKDIAILKTMGATARMIRRIFVAKGLIIGLWGTAAGTLIGAATCLALARFRFIHLPGDVYFLTTLPVKIAWTDVALVVGATLGICLVATIYPSHKAAGQAPAEALRYG